MYILIIHSFLLNAFCFLVSVIYVIYIYILYTYIAHQKACKIPFKEVWFKIQRNWWRHWRKATYNRHRWKRDCLFFYLPLSREKLYWSFWIYEAYAMYGNSIKKKPSCIALVICVLYLKQITTWSGLRLHN